MVYESDRMEIFDPRLLCAFDLTPSCTSMGGGAVLDFSLTCVGQLSFHFDHLGGTTPNNMMGAAPIYYKASLIHPFELIPQCSFSHGSHGQSRYEPAEHSHPL